MISPPENDPPDEVARLIMHACKNSIHHANLAHRPDGRADGPAKRFGDLPVSLRRKS